MESLVQGKLARRVRWGGCRNVHSVRDTTRCVLTLSLQERKEAWKYARESMNFAAQCRSLTVIRNEIRPEYQEIGSQVLQNVLHRVDNAFKDFFRRVKRGEKPGYPRYQSIRRYDSFCFPDAAGWKLKNNRLQITNIGEIKVKLHRKPQGMVKTTTIKREGECWYKPRHASFTDPCSETDK